MNETINEAESGAERRGTQEQRVSTVAGHRLCAACGFTLYGQPILREPHYQMLIIRCPECGGIAAVQEYPALGKWAGRWAALLAATWLLVLIAAVFLSAGALFGMSEGVVEMCAERYALKIAEAHQVWYEAAPEPKPAAIAQYMVQSGGAALNAYSFIDKTWWERLDRGAILASAGGWWSVLDPSALWFLWLVALVGLVVGVFWSVALMVQRRSRAFLVALLIVAIAAGFCWMAHSTTNQWAWFGGGVIYATFLAQAELAPFAVALGLAVGLGGMCLGIWIGRWVVRASVRVLLPPTFRPALAVLWTCDGLSPPSAATR